MAIAVRNAFSLDAPFTVSAGAFRFRGKPYAKGEPFPWRELGLDARELWQLWLALKVDCSSAAQPETPEVQIDGGGPPAVFGDAPPASDDLKVAEPLPSPVAATMPGVSDIPLAADVAKRERRARSRSSR